MEHFSGGGGLGWREMHWGVWRQILASVHGDKGDVAALVVEHAGGEEGV